MGMSRAEDIQHQTIPLALLAGAAFQLGQLPAMANGLLSREVVIQWEAPIHAAFLRADFVSVLNHAAKFWSVRFGDGNNNQIFTDDAVDAVEFVMIELVRALGLFAGSIRQENTERLKLALSKLEAIAAWTLRTASYETGLLIQLEASVARKFIKNATYAQLQPIASGKTSKFKSSLGIFTRRLIADGRCTLWPSQIRGVKRVVSKESFALCSPTGSGKTLVGMLAALIGLFDEEDNIDLQNSSSGQPIVLYIVPTRVFAMEIEAVGLDRFRGINANVSVLYGVSHGGEELSLSAKKPLLLIATVEKAEALLRRTTDDVIKRISLLIVDEAHQAVVGVVDEYRLQLLINAGDRSLRLESFVTRLLIRQPKIRRIAMSAVARGADQVLANWFAGSDSTPISPILRSTRQIIGRLEVHQDKFRIIADRYKRLSVNIFKNNSTFFTPTKH